MTLHSYETKLKESEDGDLRRLLERVYRGFFPFLERVEYSDDEAFQRSGCDLTIHFKKPGKGVMSTPVCERVEEKIRSKVCADYPDLLVEYLSCAERRTLGWGFTSAARWLSYVQNGLPEFLHVRLYPMQPLCQWFMARFDRYGDISAQTALGGSRYTTRSKAVPFDDPAFKIFCAAHGAREMRLEAEDIRRILAEAAPCES